jgi:predicted exporter
MTELRRRMIQDMQLHGYAERTQESYVDAVRGLAKFTAGPQTDSQMKKSGNSFYTSSTRKNQHSAR